MKEFVKDIDKDRRAFSNLKEKFFRISDGKSKKKFLWPDIRSLFKIRELNAIGEGD